MIRLRASRFGGQARLRIATARQARLRASRFGGQARVIAAWTVAFIVIGGSSSLLACPMCFDNVEETSLVNGTRLGILVMLAIVVAVQAAFAGFFFYLRKQGKRAAEAELDNEWSKLQTSPRTS